MKLWEDKVTPKVRGELEHMFGRRAHFDHNVLLLYSKDVSRLPDETAFMMHTMPEAVVQPESHDEVVRLMELADRHGVPLTPRGAGSSGVLGSVPTRGGITVYFGNMRKILSLDEENLTVTVEPGVVWKDLQHYLNKKGYDVRIQPTSSPSSTVAGWIASGGVGIGSLGYGAMRDQVVEVTLVTPKRGGEVIDGKALDVVNDALGVTGIITRATIRIRRYEPMVPFVACFDTKETLCAAIDEIRGGIRKGDLSLWHMFFSSPDWIALKQRAEGHAPIPEGMYVLTLAMTETAAKAQEKILRRICSKQGLVVGRKLAQAEWDTRFYPMRIAKIGPTLVPGEVYLPFGSLLEFLTLVEKKLKTDYRPYEGTAASVDTATCLFYSIDDERRADYALGFGFTLAFIDLAKQVGGAPYQTGAFLPHDTGLQIGWDRVRTIRQFKKEIDEDNIMNPGKLVAPGGSSGEKSWLRTLMNRMKPAPNMRLNSMLRFGKVALTLGGPMLPFSMPERDTGSGRALREFIAEQESGGLLDTWELYSCVGCNYCTEVCPMYIYTGDEHRGPRARIQAMKMLVGRTEADKAAGRGIRVSDEWVKDMYCTLCSKCEVVCQVDINFTKGWDHIKSYLTEQGYQQPVNAQNMYKSVYDPLYRNPFMQPAEKRDEWYREEYKLPQKADIVYFKGCVASYFEYRTLLNVMKILSKAGLSFTTLGTEEMCCGAPLHMSGQTDRMKEIAEHNAGAIRRRGAKLVVTACPGCFRSIKKYAKYIGPLGFEVKHMAQYVWELIEQGKIKPTKQWKQGKVIYHDPCELGRITELETGHGVYEEPRNALKAIPGLELVEYDETRTMSNCCGGGGILKAVDEPLSQKIALGKVGEAADKGATTIISACPSCNTTFGIGAQMLSDKPGYTDKPRVKVADICDVMAKVI